MLILTVDIGNTAVKWGVFQSIAHNQQPIQQGYYNHGNLWTNSQNSVLPFGTSPPTLPVQYIVLCSVVPSATSSLVNYCQHHWPKATLQVITPHLTPKLDLGQYNATTLGPDRWVNLLAAQACYPSDTVIIVDSGTATTIDVLEPIANGQQCFKGGLILPGFKVFVDSLTHTTALLPNTAVELSQLNHYPLLGYSTETALQAGLGHGYMAMLTGLLQPLINQYPLSQLIVTGGLSNSILPQLTNVFGSQVTHSPLLTLTGCLLASGL
jgi:pantothenate kinase type III